MFFVVLIGFFLSCLISIVARWYFSRGEQINLDTDDDVSYNVKDLRAPALSGKPLLLFAWLVETPLIGALLLPKMLFDSGFNRLQRIKTRLAPKLVRGPPVPPPMAAPADWSPVSTAAQLQALVSYIEQHLQSKDRNRIRTSDSILDFHRAYLKGDVSPVNVAEHLLAAVKQTGGPVQSTNCVRDCHPDDVLRQAKLSADRYGAGKPISVLDGCPIFVKDESDVKGYSTTLGTVLPELLQECDRDSELVGRMRALGAIICGKTNMHELGIAPSSKNAHYGDVRNPHDLGRDAGGSSSGSAAAVACRLVPLALGADGGGSVRVPAAFCGIWGLMPTAGRFSCQQATRLLAFSVGSSGWLASSPVDLAISFFASAGPPSKNSEWAAQLPPVVPQPPLVTMDSIGTGSVRGLKVGVFAPHFADASPECVDAADRVVDCLRQAGAEIVDISIPFMECMRLAHTVSIVSEMASQVNHNWTNEKHLFAADTRVSLAAARQFSSRDYVMACKVRARATDVYDQLFEKIDVIVTPATGCLPPPLLPKEQQGHGHSDITTVGKVMRFSFAANFLGLPSAVVPVAAPTQGSQQDGRLPRSTMFTARWWNEGVLLRVCLALDQLTDTAIEPQHRIKTLISK